MKIIKQISLIFIGILLSLIILEIGLQTASFTLTTIKKYQNKTTKDPNIVTILCLGESTTDGQWPPILQKILNEKSKNKKFNVIDEGICGTNTRIIAEKISDNLIKYNPDIVISMMGINDRELGYKKYKIKIFSLISLILSHIKQYFYCNEEDINYLNHLTLPSDRFFKIMYRIYKKTGYEFYELCPTLFRYIKETNYENNNLIKIMDELIDKKKIINPNEIYDIIEYLEIVKKYNTNQIKDFIIKNKDRISYGNILTENLLKKYDLLYLLNDIKDNEFKFDYKNIKKSNNLTKENTKKNYQYIISEIYNNNKNSLVVAMQYPIWSIEKLKNYLKDSHYYDKLIFISNEENFKQALQNHKAEEIFRDMFAKDFGHCTELGNTLIAENVAETILKLYN